MSQFERAKGDPSTEDLLASLNKALPYSDEAEKGVLSSLLQDPGERLKESQATIAPAAFYHDGNRTFYLKLLEFYEKGLPMDIVMITDSLRDNGQLDKVGGPAAITDLFCFVPSPAHYRHYKKIVLDKFILRQVIHTCSLNIHKAYEFAKEADGDSSVFVETVEERTLAIRDSARVGKARLLPRLSIAEAMDATLNEIMARAAAGGALAGWPTGFPTLDARLGGLQKGRVSIFAGLPSDGKSSIMQNVAMAALDYGARVGWYSLEMPIPEQTLRILSEKSGVDNTDLYKGLLSRQQQDDLQRAVRRLQECGGAIVDTEDANGAEILADVENSDFDVVVIDYLQLLEPDELRKGASREEIISGLSRKMKAVARRTGKHILSASQLNDQGKLRESRAIGQNADNVFLVNKCPTEREDGRATDYDDALEFDDARRLLWCEKNRGGKRHWELPMWFFGHTFTFKEIQTP